MDPHLQTMAETHTVQEIRKLIAETIHNDEFAQMYLLPENQIDVLSVEEWLQKIQQDFEWCDDIFIYLAAKMLKKEIVLLPVYPDDGHGDSGKIVVTPEEKTGTPFYMLYYKDVHFQSIVPVGNYTDE